MPLPAYQEMAGAIARTGWGGFSVCRGTTFCRIGMQDAVGVGLKPRLADVIAAGLKDEEALALVDKVMVWYQRAGKAKRLGRVIDEIGFAEFMDELGLSPVE